MIECKQVTNGSDADCKKACCCLECGERNDCSKICSYVEKKEITEPGKCGFAREEGAE